MATALLYSCDLNALESRWERGMAAEQNSSANVQTPSGGASAYGTRDVLRRAKIVATLGPASGDEATFRALVRAGLDVARTSSG
jgi:hypothetical protein